MEINRIDQNHPSFPPYLRHVYQPPKELYYKGDFSFGPGVAVVGTRKMSLYGRYCVELLVPELVRCGMTVISGLALGIDGASHLAALEAGGRTTAVLGSGLEDASIYPRAHFNLARRILKEKGCLISEYPPGTRARKHHFPERNRIVAGLSTAVLVIEAPKRSGAMITARLALESGVDVWAVPGPIDRENSSGVSELIKNGAVPITSTEDVAFALGIEPQKRPVPQLSNEERNVYEALGQGPLSTDQLARKLRVDPATVSVVLTALEMKKIIHQLGGGRFNLYTASRK